MTLDTFFTITAYVMFTVVGLCVGSFLNVLIYRLPREMNIAKPPSHCPECGERLKWYDNIPVLSYVILRGRCRYCGTFISFRYTAVELLTAGLSALCVFVFYEQGIATAIVCALACAALLVVFFSDLETNLIPDSMQIVLLLCGVGLIFCPTDYDWLSQLFGALFGGGFFLIFYLGCRLLLKREGLGFGDVKLMTVCGLLLGLKATVFALIISTVCAAIVLPVVRAIKKDGKGTEYPFGPFLAAGVIVSMFCGNYVCDAYLALIGLIGL